MNSEHQAGWYTDPTGAGEQRYWDGSKWTDQIARGGVKSTAPIPTEGIEITGLRKGQAFLLGIFRHYPARPAVPPVYVIDGHKMLGIWNHPVRYPLAPGDHIVQAYFQYFGSLKGESEVQVTVAPRAIEHLTYRAPPFVINKGTLTVDP